MSNSILSRRGLFEETIPFHEELGSLGRTADVRFNEIDKQAATGTLLTCDPNLVQHHILETLRYLKQAPRTSREFCTFESFRQVPKIYQGPVSYCRARLEPAFYGAYLQDTESLNIGAEYWRIESIYLRALQAIKDEIDFYKRMSRSGRLTGKQKEEILERYHEAITRFVVDASNFLEALRYDLPRNDCAWNV